MAVFVLSGRAEELGRGIGSGLGAEMAQTMGEQAGLFPSAPSGPVEQSEPIPPGTLGSDPALDRYAQDCFTGLFDACDELFWHSEPFPLYEHYGITCGGQVKPFTVAYCTELE